PTYEKIGKLDLELLRLTRGQNRLRLELGTYLEELVRRGGHRELGFSSFEAYVLERCGRSRRWATETRTLTRHLAELPVLRVAVENGEISWCMAVLIARHATADTEGALVAQARKSTVRAMRAALSKAKPVKPAETEVEHDLEIVTLRINAGQADIWLLEWTKRFA